MSRATARLVGLAAGAVASMSLAAPAPASSATLPDELVWLALGDSYSSGEGLRYVDQDANPSDRSCERATGRTSVNDGQGSRSWAAVAYDEVRGDMTNSTFRLLACTGAVSNEIHEQYEDEWLDGGEPRADLITFSMGGNNLGFADVIQRCIGLSIDNATGAGIVLNPAIGCDTTEVELKAAVDQLVGTSGVGPDGGQTLRDMYREVAEEAINPGGHVIVAGYPNIVEESGRWSLGWLEGNRCSRIRRSDTAMLRSATGYLNQQTANLVAEVDGEYDNVSFHWLDVSRVYENDSGRHGLCTGEPWINGLTVGAAGPNSGLLSIRHQRSFHPNQKGHDATGAAVADLIADFDWNDLQRDEGVSALTFADLDRSTTWAFEQIDMVSGTVMMKEWVYQGATPEDWIVGPSRTLPLSPEFVYLRQDTTQRDTNTADEFASFVNTYSGTDFPYVFWIALDDRGALLGAQVEWDTEGSGECAEPVPPLNDNC